MKLIKYSTKQAILIRCWIFKRDWIFKFIQMLLRYNLSVRKRTALFVWKSFFLLYTAISKECLLSTQAVLINGCIVYFTSDYVYLTKINPSLNSLSLYVGFNWVLNCIKECIELRHKNSESILKEWQLIQVNDLTNLELFITWAWNQLYKFWYE